MAAERLMVLENTGDEPIVDYWDSKELTIPAGETMTFAFGVGMHFKERHAALRFVEETSGESPDIVVRESVLLNPGTKAIDVLWDGHPYHFEPGATARLTTELAEVLIVQA